MSVLIGSRTKATKCPICNKLMNNKMQTIEAVHLIFRDKPFYNKRVHMSCAVKIHKADESKLREHKALGNLVGRIK